MLNTNSDLLKNEFKKSWNPDINYFFRLAIPLIVSGLLEQSLFFLNNLFLAQLGKTALSAGAIASWTFATLLTVLWGTLSSINIIVSRHSLEKNPENIARAIRDGLVFASIASIFAMLFIRNLTPILLLLKQNPQTIRLTQIYLRSLSWSIFPDLIFTVFLNIFIGLGRTKTNLFFTFLMKNITLSCLI